MTTNPGSNFSEVTPDPQILPLDFYLRPTRIVAQELLGKFLVRILPDKQRLIGQIVETEAYLGINDRACHTYNNKKTTRTEPMFCEGGHAYVYLIYGMYECFNVVSEKKDIPEAVLIRALEPIAGVEQLKFNRKTEKLHNLCSGPGKLCKAMLIDRSFNRHKLDRPPLYITEGQSIVKKNQIISTTRIGVDYAGADARLKLRFYIKDNSFVSKKCN
jgi:DNA-3-methyladenine glycosylase